MYRAQTSRSCCSLVLQCGLAGERHPSARRSPSPLLLPLASATTTPRSSWMSRPLAGYFASASSASYDSLSIPWYGGTTTHLCPGVPRSRILRYETSSALVRSYSTPVGFTCTRMKYLPFGKSVTSND